jgi:hypothetical protein
VAAAKILASIYPPACLPDLPLVSLLALFVPANIALVM